MVVSVIVDPAVVMSLAQSVDDIPGEQMGKVLSCLIVVPRHRASPAHNDAEFATWFPGATWVALRIFALSPGRQVDDPRHGPQAVLTPGPGGERGEVVS